MIDGDTIELLGGERVRLVQIDTPEKREECYGDAAAALARRLLPPGTRVRIEQDPDLDQVDRYQRKLAYVWKGNEDVNVTLVREGAAGVWFYGGKRGRYSSELLQATEQARSERRGLWARVPARALRPARRDVERPRELGSRAHARGDERGRARTCSRGPDSRGARHPPRRARRRRASPR